MPPRLSLIGAHAVVVLVLSSMGTGCPERPSHEWPDDLVWSPDGRHAAVLRTGFRLSDAEGNLSPELDDQVYGAAWLDSERLVLARTRTVGTFAEVAAAVGPERAQAITAQAEQAWTGLQASLADPSIDPPLEIPEDILILYVRDRHGDALREFPDVNWDEVESATAKLHTLAIARVMNDRLERGPTLNEDLLVIKAIRVAPDRRLVAFVTISKALDDDSTRIHVVPLEGSARTKLTAEGTNYSVDWTSDSRSLLYFRELGDSPGIGQFGCLARLMVAGENGVLAQPADPICLSSLVFALSDRLASLPDGRILFESRSVRLPSESGDTSNQLFLLTRKPDVRVHATESYSVMPLISDDVLASESGLAFFDVSPDRTRVIYGTLIGDVRLLTLADGREELLPLGLHREDVYEWRDVPRAVWSGPDAFTYLKRIGTRNEFILRRGNTETILSRDWPKEMLWPYPADEARRRSVQAPSPSTMRAPAALR